MTLENCVVFDFVKKQLDLNMMTIILNRIKKMHKYDSVFQSHPIFHALKSGLIFFDSVSEITKNGEKKENFLLLHIAGVFLLQQRSFSKQYQIAKAIPMVDLNKIIVTKKGLTFQSEKQQFSIKHSKYIKIANKIATVHQMIFDHPSLQFSVELDDSTQKSYEQQYFDFQSDYLLADRFIGCCFGLQVQFNENLIKETYETLAHVHGQVNIKAELAANPYILAVVQAIAYDTEIKTIALKNVSMPYFLQYLGIIAKNTISCNKIVMKNVDFTPQMKNLDVLFNETNSLEAKEFDFKRCNFTSNSSIAFFESFAKYKSDIYSLSFEDCQFIYESIDALFQSLFFSQCFHNLESIRLSGMKHIEALPLLIIQLVSCGWVLEKHCLKTLAVVNSALKIDQLFPQILTLDSGFENLDLSENTFLTPFSHKTKINSFHDITHFVLRKCKFGKGCLLSLLNALSKHDKNFTLDLSECQMDVQSWNDFYSQIEDVTVPKLQGLIWDNNEINQTNCSSFVQFVKQQPNLTELSISYCVPKIDRESVIANLIDMTNTKALESFTMKANSDSALGPELSPLLIELIRNGVIKSLNISGQSVGEKCLQTICREMPSSLVTINFDGFSPSSAETFLSICESFLDRQWLKNVEWPASDVKSAIAKSPSQYRNEMQKRIQHMKNQFSLKYGGQNDSVKSNQNISAQFSTNISEKHSGVDSSTVSTSELYKPLTGGGSIYANVETMYEFALYDEDTMTLIKECALVTGIEPVNKTLSSIDEHTHIPELLSIIKSLDK